MKKILFLLALCCIQQSHERLYTFNNTSKEVGFKIELEWDKLKKKIGLKKAIGMLPAMTQKQSPVLI